VRERGTDEAALRRTSGPLLATPRADATADTKPAGRPLEANTAARIGSFYGHSFADVRIHDDAEAGNRVASTGAIAATVGTDIAFAPGAYRPGTQLGDALIAHELAHVQQQREGGSAPDAGHERDAHDTTVGAVAHLAGVKGLPRRGAVRGSAVGLQRCGGLPSWAPPMPEGKLTPSNGRAFVTGAMVDTMFSNSPTFGPYLKTRITTGTSRCGGEKGPQVSAGHVHFHPDAEFQLANMHDDAAKGNPAHPRSCGGYERYTEAEARADTNIAAFRDQTELHINEDKAQLTDTIHESFHRYQDEDYTDALGARAMEGTTEYFTKVLCDEQTPPLAHNITYVNESAAMKRMIVNGGVGIGPVADAYFNGNISGLRAAVDAKQPGRFAAWVGSMKRAQPDYVSANKLFP
jgi:hypothetical protein